MANSIEEALRDAFFFTPELVAVVNPKNVRIGFPTQIPTDTEYSYPLVEIRETGVINVQRNSSAVDLLHARIALTARHRDRDLAHAMGQAIYAAFTGYGTTYDHGELLDMHPTTRTEQQAQDGTKVWSVSWLFTARYTRRRGA